MSGFLAIVEAVFAFMGKCITVYYQLKCLFVSVMQTGC